MSEDTTSLGARLRQLRWAWLALRHRYVFCTIATRDFLPWALVLFDSLRKHHRRPQLVLLYIGATAGERSLPIIEGVHVIGIGDLVAPAREVELRRRYSMPELCFSLKPALLRYALGKLGDRAIYLDSDIDIHGTLIEAALGMERASMLLTPHLDTPIPMDGKVPSELTIARSGAANMGFAGASKCDETAKLLDWWESRVGRWGFVDPESGYHSDQKWIDLARGFFPGVELLRHPGSNVAYWNLHGRCIARDGNGLTVNGTPLAFVHFSGFDPDKPEVLSKYQDRIVESEQPLLMEMARRFAARIVAARPAAAALAWKEGPAAAAAPAPATTTFEALPPEAYRGRLEASDLQGYHETGEEALVPVRVTNDSPHPWPVARSVVNSGGIALTWHLRGENDEVLGWDNRRYFLPRDLAPGESEDMLIGVRLPRKPGRYVLELDLLHEDFAWFSERGNPTVRINARVGAVGP